MELLKRWVAVYYLISDLPREAIRFVIESRESDSCEQMLKVFEIEYPRVGDD